MPAANDASLTTFMAGVSQADRIHARHTRLSQALPRFLALIPLIASPPPFPSSYAVITIREALGIADATLPTTPARRLGCDREQRVKLVADWLANELRFMAA